VNGRAKDARRDVVKHQAELVYIVKDCCRVGEVGKY
jgi:hypothetical protein